MTPPGPRRRTHPAAGPSYVILGVMPTVIRATGEAKDMTLDEIAQFVEDVRKAGVPGNRPIRAELSTSGKIKEVEVALDEDED